FGSNECFRIGGRNGTSDDADRRDELRPLREGRARGARGAARRGGGARRGRLGDGELRPGPDARDAARRGRARRRLRAGGRLSGDAMSAPTVTAPRGGAAPYVPPAPTQEGWYAHHQLFTIDRAAVRAAVGAGDRGGVLREAVEALLAPADGGGWSAPVQLV